MWSVLVGWGFVGVVVGLLISAAFGVLSMNPPQYTLAEVGLSISAVILLSRVGWWLVFEHPTNMSWTRMLLFSFFCFGGTGLLWYTAVRWIEGLRPTSRIESTVQGTPPSEGGSRFALSISPFIYHNSPNGMWFGVSAPKLSFILPVGLLVGIRIVNLQSVPALVERYSLYAWENEQWNWLNRIDTRFGRLYLVLDADFKHASPQHSGHFLDDEIGEKPIGPHEARHGWAAFKYELKPLGVPKKFKLIVVDVVGHEESYIYPPSDALLRENQDTMWGEVMDAERNADISAWEKRT